MLAAAKDMLRRGLVEGTAGNISARREDGNLVITPSSVDYGDMTIDEEGGGVERLGKCFHRRNVTPRN